MIAIWRRNSSRSCGLLRRIARAQLVEREADEVQRILYFMRQAAGQLTQRREALEPVELLLALARVAQLPDHLVEAARQQSDFVAPMRLGHRLQPARRDILRRVRHRVDRLHVTIGQDIREHQPDRENRERDQSARACGSPPAAARSRRNSPPPARSRADGPRPRPGSGRPSSPAPARAGPAESSPVFPDA